MKPMAMKLESQPRGVWGKKKPAKKPRKREVWLEALEKIVAHGCADCAEWAAEALRYKGAPE